MKNKKLSAILAFSTAILLFPLMPSSVSAQITCTGAACSNLPLSPQQLDQMLLDFRFQYLDVLMDDMGRAAVVSNMSGAPIGTVNLSGFTAGAGVAGGIVEEHKVPVLISGIGTMTDIPSGGASVVPRAHFGMNLGKLFGKSYDPFKDSEDSKPSWISPARFDIYINLMDYKYQKKNEITYNYLNSSPKLEDTFSASSNYKGADLYYHIMEGKGIAPKRLFDFLGLSVGVGMHESLQKIEYYNADSKSVINLNSGTQVIWHGSDIASLNVKARSNTAELKTGIRFLYFFTLTGAVGSAANYGSSKLQYTRYGRIYLSNDIAAAAGLTLPDAWLALNLTSEKDIPKRTNFQKVGLELNFAAFKIAFEGMQVGKDKGGSVSLRFVW